MSDIADECPECGGLGEVGTLGTRRKCDHQYLREQKIAEIRNKSEFGRVIHVQANTVHDLMADIRFLLSELAEEKRHGELGWEQSNKWIEENGRIRAELDQVKKERDAYSEVLEGYAITGLDGARSILFQYKKGDTKDA